MNLNFCFSKRANNKNIPPLSTSLYNDKFEKNKSKSLNQIKQQIEVTVNEIFWFDK